MYINNAVLQLQTQHPEPDALSLVKTMQIHRVYTKLSVYLPGKQGIGIGIGIGMGMGVGKANHNRHDIY